jgi:hypothetical protein
MANKLRYWVFYGDLHYPNGGMDDFEKSFENITEAIGYLKGRKKSDDLTWGQIYDSLEDSIIYEL